MTAPKRDVYQFLALVSLLGTIGHGTVAAAQPIAPANDGTGTAVNNNGDRFDITGGTFSGDGANLFHSFERFNLNSSQTANFISTPDINNILGRVIGGDPSIINGLIQVTGGNPNLYLMNPAGILFGPHASLNIPASFTVTTATGIGFNNNNLWFNSIGNNDYQNLVGAPNRYRFDLPQTGAIVNEGNLELQQGQNLTVLAGTTINTGQISTAGGNITIAAVEGENIVRISQPGHLLNLEISPLANGQNAASTEGINIGQFQQIKPLNLPQLLTIGKTANSVTNLQVNQEGQIVLTAPNLENRETSRMFSPSPSGGTAIEAGSIDVSNNLPGGRGGEVNILGDRVGIIDSNINANGTKGGGNVFIGGAFQGNNRLPASRQTYINQNSTLSANSLENGNGGRVIIWSDGTTRFEGNISATGGEYSGNGGFLEVSGKQQLIVRGNADVSATNGRAGTILFDPENLVVGETDSKETGQTPVLPPEKSATETADNEETTSSEKSATETAENKRSLEEPAQEELGVANLETRNQKEEEAEIGQTPVLPVDPFAQDEDANVTISAENINDLRGEIILQADNDITVNQTIETTESVATSVTIKAGRSINLNADINTAAGNGNINLLGNDNNANIANRASGAASINQKANTSLNAGSGNITIRLGNLGEVGDINLANLTTTGQVLINANGGNIGAVSPNSLITSRNAIFRTEGRGAVGLSDSPLGINVNRLEAVAGSGGAFFGATTPLTVGGANGNLTGISTSGGGDLRLNADGKITVTEDISTAVNDRSSAGNISLQTTRGGIDATGATINSSSESGKAGNINLTAVGNILTSNIDASSNGNGRGGNITFNAGRNIDTTRGTIDSASFNGNGGKIDFTAAGNIGTADLTSANGDIADDGGNTDSFMDPADADLTSLGEIQNRGFFRANRGGNGNAGPITLNAEGNINTAGANVSSFSVGGNGGDVAFTARGNLNLGDIASFSQEGRESGGNVSLSAGGNITAGNIVTFASGRGDAGHISIETTSAATGETPALDIGGNLAAYALEGRGGKIDITTGGDINFGGDIESYSSGSARGGNMTINSGGEIDATNSNLRAYSGSGNGGNINLTAAGDIETAAVETDSGGRGNGGNILLQSRGGNINTTAGNLRTSSSEGDAGNVGIAAAGNIDAGDITSRSFSFESSGGNITLESSGGAVNTNGGGLRADSKGDGGDISIVAEGDINTGILESFSSENGTGGNIDLTSNGGAIATADAKLNASSSNTAGNISLNANTSVTTGDLDSSGSQQGGEINITSATGAVNAGRGSLDSSAEAGIGGDISITAEGNVITGEITAYGGAQGGNVTITSLSSDVNTTREPDVSSEGTPGEVTVNASEGSISMGSFDNITVEDGGQDNPFEENADADVTSDADKIDRLRGDVSLEAHNDITINEAIASDTISNLEIKAGRNININADIDTSGGNGNIALEANVPGETRAGGDREPGPGNLTMAPGTTISAGRGNISIELGTGGDANPIGNITLGTLRSQGAIAVNARGGNILRAANNSIIRGSSALFQTTGSGAIGSATEPLRLRVQKLEATAGSGGAFFNSPNTGLTIGGASDLLQGISTEEGGDIEVTAKGDIAVTESLLTTVTNNLPPSEGGPGGISQGGNITLNSGEGAVDTSRTSLDSKADAGNGGNIAITAAGDIKTGNISSASGDDGRGGNITITTTDGSINTTAGEITSSSLSGSGGEINLVVGRLATEDRRTRLLPVDDNETDGLSAGDGTDGTDEASPIERRNSPSTGNIIVGNISSRSDGGGSGGRISLETSRGAIDTTGATLSSRSQSGSGGEINLAAEADITTARLESFSSGTGNGGNIVLESSSGAINTTAGGLESFSIPENGGASGNGGNISLDAGGNINVGQLNTLSDTGQGGDINVNSGGNIATTAPNSSNTGLFSNSNDGDGGNISLQAAGNITANQIRTEADGETSNAGRGGSVDIEAGGRVRIRDLIRSYGLEQSGDVNIQSQSGRIVTGAIETIAPNGTSGNVTLRTTGQTPVLRARGDVRTADITSEGGKAAGKIEIVAPDGSIRTEDLQSSSQEGEAGGIDLQAEEDIETEDQTVNSGEGDSNINNDAGGDIATGNQRATADNGDASINNNAGGDIATGNQRATTDNGDASINNDAGGNISGGNQTATATGGNASINNRATGNVNLRDQLAQAEGGNASISNQAGGNVNLRDQIATATGGNASINNQAGGNVNLRDQVSTAIGGNASIDNQTGGNLNVRDQVSTAIGGNPSINNQAGGDMAIATQTAFADGGNATINNNAGRDLTVGGQNAFANGGVNTITNNAGGNLAVPQTAAPPVSRLSAPPIINNRQPVVQNFPAAPIINNRQPVVQNFPAAPVLNNRQPVVQNFPAAPVLNNRTPVVQNLPAAPVLNNRTPVVQNFPAAPVLNNPTPVVQNLPATQAIAPGTPPQLNFPPVGQTSRLSPPPVSPPPEGTTENLIRSAQNRGFTNDITSPSSIHSTDNYRDNIPGGGGAIASETGRRNAGVTGEASVLRNLNVINSNLVTVATSSPTLDALESDRTAEFADYLALDPSQQFVSTKNAREILADIAVQTGNQSAVVYVTANPEGLQLVLYTSAGEAILKSVPEANREKLLEVVSDFHESIVNPRYHRSNSYLPLAQKLYGWLVAPISEELEAANIDTLLFSMGSGLRGLPVAALHDGEEFLVQKYSLSLIPSISLMDSRYQSLENSRVLAMGASEFKDFKPLPAVPLEIATISEELWEGNSFLNREFTLNNLVKQRQSYPYEIIHLATHAEFQPGEPRDSYIQLWGDRLQVDLVRQLGWNDPAVELLVLSACRTAIGDANAELGFAGLAVAAGVKSALASVWYVSDEGTLALMTEFYTHLNNAEIKSEALRQAQLAMIEGKVAIEGGQLRGSGVRGAVVLPPELLGGEGVDLSHPYYWSGFTMIGSPW